MAERSTDAVHEITEAPSVVRHGWLSPEGRMHEIEYEGHDDFADEMGVSQNVLYKRGWVKLSRGDWYGDQWDSREIGVTQRQYDYIYGWHEARRLKFPTELFAVK